MQLDPLALTLTSGVVGVAMMGMLALAQAGQDDSPAPLRWWLAGDALFVLQQFLLLPPLDAYARLGLPALRVADLLLLCSSLVMAAIACHAISLRALFWRRWPVVHPAACVAAVGIASFAVLAALQATRWQTTALVAMASLGAFTKGWLVLPTWRRYKGAMVLAGLNLLIALAALSRLLSGGLADEHWLLSAQGQVLRPPVTVVLELFVSTLNTLAFMLMMQERLRERIERLGTTDALTGLLNRRGIEAALGRELMTTLRDQRPLALALIDLDHFKRINDEFGHHVGDRVLAGFGTRLLQGIRAGDSAGRWGGEEFLVVMPSTELQDAVLAVERIRDATRAEPLAEQAPRVTLSAGVCVLGTSGESIEGLVKRADRALYRAKVQRDKVCADPSAPSARVTPPAFAVVRGSRGAAASVSAAASGSRPAPR